MTGIKQSIKARLVFFAGTIVVLFILFFILQYNNFIFTQKTIAYHDHINRSQIIPEKLQLLHYKYIRNDIFTDNYYTLEKSNSLDSIFSLLNSYKNEIDSIQNPVYIPINSKTKKMLLSLHNQCNLLTQKYLSLQQEILNRGLYTTGQSGEWHRFGTYLQDLASSYDNPVLVREVSILIKLINEYQLNKTNDKIQQLLEKINSLKVRLSIKKGLESIDIPEPFKLKFIKELDSFSALTIAIQKTDIKIGLLNNEGTIGKIEVDLGILQDKSFDVYQNIKSGINQRLIVDLIVKTLLIIIFSILYIYIIFNFSKILNFTIGQIKKFSSELTLGKLPRHLNLSPSSEFNEISQNFNSFIASLREKIRFASKLEAGQINVTSIPLSEEDTLANALLDMEKSLGKAAEEDKKYKIEEQKRAWANEGIAKFGEILRMQTDNLATLSDRIIEHIVKYLNANQGGIFLYNDDDQFDIYLELISAFAFDRKKYIKKRYEIGESLVGTCAQEKQTISLTEIPDNYIEITSGLGDAPPRSLLMVPLLTEKNIFGVLEIASFNIFQPHEIEFIEKLAQNIASTFATVKININTTRLLEQSKKQAEEMAQQEEEMRQNLEELQATQEESARREAEINSLVNAVDASALVIQTDMDGRIMEVNKKFSNIVKMNRDELIGRYLKSIFMFNAESDEFYNLLNDLKKGKIVTRSEETHPESHQVFLQVHYSPILDHDGNPYKVLGIATNITGHRLLEQTLNEKDETLSELDFFFNQYKSFIKEGFIVCELSLDAIITDVNENYAEITGYHVEELIGKNYRKFLRQDELKQFETIWTEVLKDKTYKGVIKRTKPTGDESWLMTSFVPFKDKKDAIVKVYLLAQDVTEKKLKYQVLEEANKEIDRLRGLKKNDE
jgi:PAS domain S-box-containing protein